MMFLQILLLKDARFEENKEYDVIYDSQIAQGYTDVTGLISGWHDHGHATIKDYKFVRKQIQDLITDFELLSNEDKIRAGHFMSPDPITIFDSGVLGNDFQFWKEDWIENSEISRIGRWEAAKSLIFDLIVDAKTLLSEIINDGLHDKYIEGIESFLNDNTDGLFDCLESTSTYASAGLLNNGYEPVDENQTMAEISVLLMDVLREGNY